MDENLIIEGNKLIGVKNILTKEIIIPEGIEELGVYAFIYCRNLEKIKLPSTLKRIGGAAFYYGKIKEIEISEGIEELRKFTFYNCKRLEKITLPSTLKKIGPSAFENCQRLEKVTLPSTLKKIASSTFKNCGNLKEIEIPEGVEYIENNAFENCRNLKKVTLPSTLKNISAFVFKNCENLKEIKLNNYIIENGYELPIENIFDKAKAQFFKQINENIDINLEYEYQKGKNLKIFVDTIIDDLLKGNITYEEFMILVNKFKIVLKSIPLKNFLPYEVINKMDEQLLEKFDFKLWVKLIRNPLYTINAETKNSLIELIGIFGLFEKDEERDIG